MNTKGFLCPLPNAQIEEPGNDRPAEKSSRGELGQGVWEVSNFPSRLVRLRKKFPNIPFCDPGDEILSAAVRYYAEHTHPKSSPRSQVMDTEQLERLDCSTRGKSGDKQGQSDRKTCTGITKECFPVLSQGADVPIRPYPVHAAEQQREQQRAVLASHRRGRMAERFRQILREGRVHAAGPLRQLLGGWGQQVSHGRAKTSSHQEIRILWSTNQNPPPVVIAFKYRSSLLHVRLPQRSKTISEQLCTPFTPSAPLDSRL
eukprot:219508-Pyramimonas_sp.AAC.1